MPTKLRNTAKSTAQLLAERLLGADAGPLHANLMAREIVRFPIRNHRYQLCWGMSLDEAHRGMHLPVCRPDCECRYHMYTGCVGLWHVELRDPRGWRPRPSDEEFVWMGMSMLALPDPFSIPGVKEHACISFFPMPYEE